MSNGTAITVGSFDGAHRGHLELVRAARWAVGERGRVVVLSFDPHPLSVLRPEDAPRRLSSFEQRVEWLKQVSSRCSDSRPIRPAGTAARPYQSEGLAGGRYGALETDLSGDGLPAGADEVVGLSPTPEVLGQSPEAFLESLAMAYSPAVIVEGRDFRFGRGRAGSPLTLVDLEARYGYRTIIIDPVEATLTDHSVVVVSSSMIRWLVGRGRVRDAAALLGRPYERVGEVVAGDRRGREIGVPTANLDHCDRLLPADGVYGGVAVRPDGRSFPAAISVGVKPTFGDHPRVCEAHLIGYEGPLDDYGWKIRVRFGRWLRDQIAYRQIDQLTDQIRRDLEQVTSSGRLSPVCP